jgi:hypothetical protein
MHSGVQNRGQPSHTSLNAMGLPAEQRTAPSALDRGPLPGTGQNGEPGVDDGVRLGNQSGWSRPFSGSGAGGAIGAIDVSIPIVAAELY